MKYAQYWQGADGIRNVKPNRGGIEFPEGFNAIGILESLMLTPCVEVGCGYGRLVSAFEPGDYTGVDCNVEAIDIARRDHAEHSFHVVNAYDYPPSRSKLAYTVAMHIPDDEYPEFVSALVQNTSDQVVIAEILGREKRRELEKKPEGWIHATFGRSVSDHEKEFAKHDWSLHAKIERQYTGKNAVFTFLEFRRK
jgi:methylase of polypeptide subunit release factors